MDGSNAWNALLEAAHTHDDRLGAIRVERLPDVREDFARIGLDTTPYFSFAPPDDLGFAPRSVLVTATPSAPSCVAFRMAGGEVRAAIPPAYIDEHTSGVAALAYLQEAAEAVGHRVARPGNLPRKPIAVHAGLGQYGRCDTVFFPGLGSFATLNVFYSDVPVPDAFAPLGRMERCRGCTICRESCPSSAIPDDMGPIDARRCLTEANEGRDPFPDWVQPGWHNALVGCMRCQGACPENAGFLDDVRVAKAFDEADTARILEGGATRADFEDIGLGWYAPVMGRNLRALLPHA